MQDVIDTLREVTELAPRDYQLRAFQDCRDAVGSGIRSFIVEAPTGAGKTFISSMFIKMAEAKGKTSLFLAPKRELIHQTSKALSELKVNHGIIMAGEPLTPECWVQVASKDTLSSRVLRRKRMPAPHFDIVIVDECHGSLGAEWLNLLTELRKTNPNIVIIGLTATPARGDGKPLGKVYKKIIHVESYANLIRDGWLVPVRVYAPDTPDMRGVQAKDFDQEGARRLEKKIKLIGDVVEKWKLYAEGRPTVVFAPTVEASIFLKNQFLAAGVAADHVDANTPTLERDRILQDLESGDIDVICNCDVLTAGWDCPRVSCVVLAVPSRSIVKYRQRAGRALRPHPASGKQDMVLIDHAGAVFMHGFPDDDIPWTLDGNGRIEDKLSEERQTGKRPDPRCCGKCFTVYYTTGPCPNCGERKHRNGTKIAIENGLLKEVKRKEAKDRIGPDYSPEGVRRFWDYCLSVCANKGSTFKQAAAMFSRKYKSPPWNYDLNKLPKFKEWQRKVAEVMPEYTAEGRREIRESREAQKGLF